MPNLLKDKSLDELSEYMQDAMSTSEADYRGRTEFLKRQTVAIQETAEHTKKYTKYMFWSVVLLLLSVIGTLFFELLNYLKPLGK